MYMPEEQEGFINIDYFTGVVKVYSNRKTIIRRLLNYLNKDLYKIISTEEEDGEIIAINIEMQMKDLGKALQSRIWKSSKEYTE